MSHRDLIDALLAHGRAIHPLPPEVRDRIVARILAVTAAETQVRSDRRDARRTRRKRHLAGARVSSRWSATRASRGRSLPYRSHRPRREPGRRLS